MLYCRLYRTRLSGTMRQSIAQRPKNSTIEKTRDKGTYKLTNSEKNGKKMRESCRFNVDFQVVV